MKLTKEKWSNRREIWPSCLPHCPHWNFRREKLETNRMRRDAYRRFS